MPLSASRLAFPTSLHEEVAALARDFVRGHALVDTVLVVNSCARGTATADSDLDLAALVVPGTSWNEMRELKTLWRSFIAGHPLVRRLRDAARWGYVHASVFDGRFEPTTWDEGGGPDPFEIRIGNFVAHAAPFVHTGPRFAELRARWLPYYDDALRSSRLGMVREACVRDLDLVRYDVGRDLRFQAFDRLYKALQEFLQALFIAHRIYPVAYNKWIREQVGGWLGLEALYSRLLTVAAVTDFEGPEMITRAEELRGLLERWVESPA